MKQHRLLVELLIGCAFCATRAIACDVAGRVDGLLVNNVKVIHLDAPQLSIRRDGKDLAVDDGAPICRRDVITARSGVVANVRVGDVPEKDNVITLYGEAAITVDNPSGITATLGRIFALLRGAFDVRTNFGTLGARGTQFDVDTTATGLTVVQLEGEVEVGGGGAPGQLLRPLQKLGVTGSSQPGEPSPLDAVACADITRAHSAVISGTRPQLPFEASGRSADLKTIARNFADARESLLCHHDVEAAPELAQAWADYAEPGGVLKLLSTTPPTSGGQDGAIYANSVGNAFRQVGQSREAINWYNRALAIDGNFAYPYNGMGDAHRDLGLAALGSRDLATARNEFDLAQQSYEKSLDPALWGKEGGTNRAIPLVNLGELAILRISLDPAQSAALLDQAGKWFDDALHATGGNYAFAELGLARIDFMRAIGIPEIVVQGPEGWNLFAAQLAANLATESARRPHFESARRRLGILLAVHREFSAGALLLGEVNQLLGSSKDATLNYGDAIRFDPHNVMAYLRLSEIAPKKERPIYEAAFRSAAFPALVPVLKGREKLATTARPPTDVRDVRAFSPSVTEVNFDLSYDGQWKPVVFKNAGNAPATVGEIAIRGDDAADFTFSAEQCANRALEPNASCEIRVRFTGTRERDRWARLVVGSSEGPDAEVKLRAPRRVSDK